MQRATCNVQLAAPTSPCKYFVFLSFCTATKIFVWAKLKCLQLNALCKCRENKLSLSLSLFSIYTNLMRLLKLVPRPLGQPAALHLTFICGLRKAKKLNVAKSGPRARPKPLSHNLIYWHKAFFPKTCLYHHNPQYGILTAVTEAPPLSPHWLG